MTYRLFYGVIGLFILVLMSIGWGIWRQNTRATLLVAPASPLEFPSESMSLIVAPGRVEPISEEVEIGTEIPGRVEDVLVQEGDDIQHGQVLAVLQRHDYEAQLMAAKARLEQVQAELQRLLNGARKEERREVWATVEQAEAVLRNAEVELKRRQMLLGQGYIAREEVDRVQRDLQVARARFQEANERYAFVTADAREDERARAQAAVGLARAQVREAEARLDKTLIRSPLNGTVLRRHVLTGEIVSPEAAKTTLFIVADTTTLRVRAEIDETDIGKLQVGLKAHVTAAAYGDTKFLGRVVQIGQVLGGKNVYTNEPTERVDTKILETLIELDRGQPLVAGLRVDVFIEASPDNLDRLSHISSLTPEQPSQMATQVSPPVLLSGGAPISKSRDESDTTAPTAVDHATATTTESALSDRPPPSIETPAAPAPDLTTASVDAISKVETFIRQRSLDGDASSLQVWSNKKSEHVYEEGEKLLVHILTTFPAYLQVDYFQADGQVVHLLPHPMVSNRVQDGQTLTLGKADSLFQFNISPPFGEEMLTVIASREPLATQTGVMPAERASFYIDRLGNQLGTYQAQGKAAVATLRIRTQKSHSTHLSQMTLP